MDPFSPESSDATVTVVVMPITMPSTVKPERSLWLQTASSAIPSVCLGLILMAVSFRPQRLNRIKAGCAPGRIPTGNDSDDARNQDRENDVGRRYAQRRAGEDLKELGNRRADNEAEDTSRDREEDGLRQELQHDVAFACAEALANADLTGTLRDADQHDVHHHDAADDE